MNKYTYISNSEQETLDLAKKIASKLKPTDIVLLCGDLGSGKTKFTQGVLSYFNLDKQISSPTYTIVNNYKNDIINIYHFDLYRLNDSSEFFDIGGEEYFEKGLCLIEWGELIEDYLPSNYIKIDFSRDTQHEFKRILNITYDNDSLV